MSAEQRSRSAARIAGLIAAPAVTATAVASKWASGKIIMFFAAFGLLGAAIGIGLFVAGGSRGKVEEGPAIVHSAAVASSSAANPPGSTTAPEAATAPAATTAPAMTPAITAAITTASVGAKPILPAPGDTLVAETALLQKAHSVIGSDPAAALAVCEEHRKSYPGGQLAAERELLAIDALKRLGRNREAKTRGEAFIAKNPQSFYVERVRKLIEGL